VVVLNSTDAARSEARARPEKSEPSTTRSSAGTQARTSTQVYPGGLITGSISWGSAALP